MNTTKSKRTLLTLESVILKAKRYSSRSQFKKECGSSYAWCIRNNKIDNKKIFGHMKKRVRWNIPYSVKPPLLRGWI